MEHVFQRQPGDLQLKATAQPFVYSELQILGKAILCYAFRLIAVKHHYPQRRLPYFMVGFCAFFFVTLVEAFGTVGMGCDVFYFSLVTNTASL